uniref:Protein RIC1 homolog n=1 Tax=Acrobeloides nanus TaxID=290746 RepID=A0A914EG37_9BILA
MFLPDSCDFRFSIPINEPVQYISGNREKSFFIVATDSTLFVYLANPHLLICTYKRDAEETSERGEYRKVYWRHDSSSICVTTSKHCVYIYTIETSEDSDVFNLHDPYNSDYGRISQEFFLKQKRPKISLYLAVVAKLESFSTCVASLKDELFVCLRDGWVHRLSWTGEVLQDLSFNIRNVPFSTDQLHAKSTKLTGLSVYVADIVYCPLIGGLCCVLSDGRAGLFISSSHRFQPQNVAAVWALGLKDAVCCAANHKFRLIYFGCRNGDIAAYHLDDTNGSLVQTYRVSLSIKNSREYLAKLGPVHQIQCISQGYVFAVIWKLREASPFQYQNGSLSNGNLEALEKQASAEASANPPPVVAIFSPFGIQWWCSLEDASDRPAFRDISYNCIEWGPEGFQLWAGSDESVTLTHLVRSIYINQPSAEYHDRVIMVGANKVMLSPQRRLEKLAKAPYCVWNTFRIPYEYISLNWPIRFVGIDEECARIIAVAGNRGFAYYSLKSSKWKLFRNEAQEQALLVTGGVAVFNDFIVVTGCDMENDEENVFIYSCNQQLESSSATKFPVSQRIMMMNLRDDHMLTFDVAATISIFILKQIKNPKNPDIYECQIERCAEIRINEMLPHPTCVISTQLTSLNYHSEASFFCHGMDSLLVNVSGHLLLLSPFNKENAESDDDSHFQLHQPMLIASQVERVWLQPGHRDIPHLNKAVWINSGIRKMKVWLPLFHSGNMSSTSQESAKNFIARRIMLPIELNVYPIAIDEDCLACGVESLPSSTTSKCEELVPILVHNVTRNNEVFIHCLLRQLLKRNLGIYALEIASTCRQLPYFGHILELLLHDVLDEEATSSEPIPDPLLPRVVAFIHEFPEYLQTIVHCARKTELAFWNLLFSVSHHPRELFKMCLKEDQLDTATSCLIILQSMESTVASVQHATRLLEEALNKRRWLIARDIVRFLRSIDGTELDEVPESPLYQKLIPKGNKPLHVLSDSASDDYNLVFNSISDIGTTCWRFVRGLCTKGFGSFCVSFGF